MAGSDPIQKQLDDIKGAIRTLTDRTWDWRDAKALALLLTRVGGFLLLLLTLASVRGWIPPLDAGANEAEPADVVDVETVEAVEPADEVSP